MTKKTNVKPHKRKKPSGGIKMSAKDNEIGECEEYLPIQEWKEENLEIGLETY